MVAPLHGLELAKKNNSSSLSDLIPITTILTEEDKEPIRALGAQRVYTVDEWETIFPAIDKNKIFYMSTGFYPQTIYFDSDKSIYLYLHFVDLYDEDRFAEQQKLCIQHIAELEAAVKKQDYLKVLLPCPEGVRMELLNIILPTLKGGKAYELFMDYYSHNDFGFDRLEKSAIEHAFASKTPSQKAQTKKLLSAFPDEFTIYRGEASASLPANKAISWTADINVANFFACRPSGKGAYIHVGTVKKGDVIEYVGDRSESEIIVWPEKVLITDTIKLLDIGDVWDNDGSEAAFYQDYREHLREVPFTNDTEQHGRLHCLRVLFFVLIIGANLFLSEETLEELCQSAIYHDCARDNDGIDEKHGAASRKVFINHWGKNAFVEDVIKWHCIDDEVALPHFSKYSSEQQLAFKIFKDADALDRVRFGSRGIDLNMLRVDFSKSLTHVAETAFQFLKL